MNRTFDPEYFVLLNIRWNKRATAGIIKTNFDKTAKLVKSRTTDKNIEIIKDSVYIFALFFVKK